MNNKVNNIEAQSNLASFFNTFHSLVYRSKYVVLGRLGALGGETNITYLLNIFNQN